MQKFKTKCAAMTDLGNLGRPIKNMFGSNFAFVILNIFKETPLRHKLADNHHSSSHAKG